MFHFTARWQLLTGVPTVQSGQDNLEVLMSDRHQITEDSKETPTQHLTHNIYSIHGDFGEEGRRTYEDVHVWMKLVFRIKNMNIHKFWKYFDICDIFCSFLKISYRIFLKSTVSCCCHPKDTSILSPSCWLQHGKKISAFCAMNNGTYETYSIFLFWTLKSGGVLLSETKKNQNSVKLRLPPECSVMITLMQCYSLNRCKIGDRKLSMKNNHLSLNVTPCVIIILMWYLTHKMLIYVFQNVSILHHRLKNIMRGDTI